MPARGYGRIDLAEGHARHNIALFERHDVDVIVTDCATCGSTLKEYGSLLADDPEWAPRAQAFSAEGARHQRVPGRDSGSTSRAGGSRRTVTYHDPVPPAPRAAGRGSSRGSCCRRSTGWSCRNCPKPTGAAARRAASSSRTTRRRSEGARPQDGQHREDRSRDRRVRLPGLPDAVEHRHCAGAGFACGWCIRSRCWTRPTRRPMDSQVHGSAHTRRRQGRRLVDARRPGRVQLRRHLRRRASRLSSCCPRPPSRQPRSSGCSPSTASRSWRAAWAPGWRPGRSRPARAAAVVCLTRMNRILEIDTANATVRAEAGVVTADLQAEVEKQGLFYPPDPSSIRHSTIGGNVACNAGGPRCLKYGVTGDYVLGLTVVLADGQDPEDRRQADQGRDRLRPERALHRVGRNARPDHRGAAAPGGPAPPREDLSGGVRLADRRLAHGQRDPLGRHRPGHPGADGPDGDRLHRRGHAPGAAHATSRPCCSSRRTAPAKGPSRPTSRPPRASAKENGARSREGGADRERKRRPVEGAPLDLPFAGAQGPQQARRGHHRAAQRHPGGREASAGDQRQIRTADRHLRPRRRRQPAPEHPVRQAQDRSSGRRSRRW